MENIIGINLLPGCISAACVQAGKPLMIPKQRPYPKETGKLFEAIREDASQEWLTQGSDPLKAICVAPASMDYREKDRLRILNSHVAVSRFLPPTVTAALMDYHRIKAFYDQREETTTLVCSAIGDSFEVAVLDISAEMVEVLAVQSMPTTYYYDQLALLNRVLKASEKANRDIRRLLLMGELVPELKDDLLYTFSKASVAVCSPEDAVLGAALYGGKLNGKYPAALILNVQANALGLETVRTTMVKGNTSIATAQAKVFTNAEKDQTGMNILLYEEINRSQDTHPQRIPACRYHIKDLPPMQKGEARIEVKVDIDPPGTIKVTARDIVRGRDLTLHSGLKEEYPYPVEWEETEADPAGTENLIRELLPVYDDLERAMIQPTSNAAYKKGVELTLKKLTETLKKQGAEPYGSVGETFDPKIHEAAVHICDINLRPNVVSRVYRKGFRLNGRIIRYAMVQVAN